MKMSALLGTVALTALMWPLQAGSGADSLSANQRAEINKMIRAYILENPEIIPEAVDVLRNRETSRMISSLSDEIFNDGISVQIGPANAPVTVVEFFDYRCGFCKRAYADMVRLMEGQENVRFIFKEFPILDRGDDTTSRLASRMALAADRQGKYTQFRNAVMTAQGALTEDRLYTLANRAGLDERQLASDMRSSAINRAIDANIELGRKLGVNGTPSYVINDRIVSGAVGYQALKSELDAARIRLAEAG